MTAAPHPLPTVPAGSDRGLQRRRRLRAARTQVGVSVQTRLLPTGGTRRRQRLQVCGAANTLTALGVRVQVVGPPTPWPRRRVVVTHSTGRLADLAVATVVRGEPVHHGGDVPPGETVCPVVVRYRVEGRPGYLADGDVPGTVAGIAAVHGLVLEVHLLAAES